MALDETEIFLLENIEKFKSLISLLQDKSKLFSEAQQKYIDNLNERITQNKIDRTHNLKEE